MPPDQAKYLRDILDAAGAIQQYAAGKTLDDYLQTRALRDAVNWNFCVMGEALAQLSKLDETTADQITDRPKIIGLRNQLIHGYGVINHRITWNIVETKLSILIREVTALLDAGEHSR
jgi:uncharacterized protein with HEPN domain